MSSREPSRRATSALPGRLRRYGPGLLLTAAGGSSALALSRVTPLLSALTLAVVLGAVLRNVGLVRDDWLPGVTLGTKRLLRAGVVLLGLQLAVSEVLDLDVRLILLVVATVAVTYFTTLWLGPRLGVSWGTTLLIATGFSICGASAAVAMNAVSDSDEEELVTAIALVTVFGGIAIFVLPLLQAPFGLSAEAFGAWTGASVHEVAQVVAAASPAGQAAIVTATVVKLTRVVMLAPLIAGYSLVHRRAEDGSSERRPPLVPLFVLGFIALVLVRSSDVVPEAVVSAAATVTTLLFACALFGLGAGVHLATLRRTGASAATLGLASSVIAAGTSLFGILLIM